jgi:predicted membrane-bound spermidine synthase
VGSWLRHRLARSCFARFIGIELLVGLVGGFSSTLLFLAFAYTRAFRLVLYVLVVILGIFVGLEIPLLMRILKDRYAFKDVVANVLTFDYLGALAASLAFPILLVPKLGLVRSALRDGQCRRRALVGLALPRPPGRSPCARERASPCCCFFPPAWRRDNSPTSPKTTSTPMR